MKPGDTSDEAWRVLIELQRKMLPEEKIRLALERSEFIRRLEIAALKVQFPGYSDRQIFLEVARRRLGPELFEKVYGGGDEA